MCHGGNVAESFVKNFHVKSGTVEKYRIRSSLLAKNKIREPVFFADDAWFTLNRNLEGKSNG
jgi:hypothetical protein